MNSCYVYCNVVGPVCGDLDLGIVGLDTFSEHGQDNDNIIIVHEPEKVIFPENGELVLALEWLAIENSMVEDDGVQEVRRLVDQDRHQSKLIEETNQSSSMQSQTMGNVTDMEVGSVSSSVTSIAATGSGGGASDPQIQERAINLETNLESERKIQSLMESYLKFERQKQRLMELDLKVEKERLRLTELKLEADKERRRIMEDALLSLFHEMLGRVTQEFAGMLSQTQNQMNKVKIRLFVMYLESIPESVTSVGLQGLDDDAYAKHPLSSAPEPKRRSIPSKWEAKKYVRAICQGLITFDKTKEEDSPYLLWGDDSGSTERANHLTYIPAPNHKLPGKTFLLLLSYTVELINMAFDQLNIDPESLKPKLPSRKELKPYPTTCYRVGWRWVPYFLLSSMAQVMELFVSGRLKLAHVLGSGRLMNLLVVLLEILCPIFIFWLFLCNQTPSVSWIKDDKHMGLKLRHFKIVTAVEWHQKGDYFSTVMLEDIL
ncbi:hypothetical protein JHK82_050007 [Glycine max]|nr:hypothetical protein JHK86_049884 [Glycine max]KAG5091229.1 hypothetical protein JHK82_050007 [Glycine max]